MALNEFNLFSRGASEEENVIEDPEGEMVNHPVLTGRLLASPAWLPGRNFPVVKGDTMPERP
jgi:hypothetical protein